MQYNIHYNTIQYPILAALDPALRQISLFYFQIFFDFLGFSVFSSYFFQDLLRIFAEHPKNATGPYTSSWLFAYIRLQVFLALLQLLE